jgi:type III restriction enzyme
LDRNDLVDAWVKNDHLGFEIVYIYRGVVKKYRPDFLIRLNDGTILVLEVKGQETDEATTKHRFLGEWIEALNGHGGFGVWKWDVSRGTSDIEEILEKHCAIGCESPA